MSINEYSSLLMITDSKKDLTALPWEDKEKPNFASAALPSQKKKQISLPRPLQVKKTAFLFHETKKSILKNLQPEKGQEKKRKKKVRISRKHSQNLKHS